MSKKPVICEICYGLDSRYIVKYGKYYNLVSSPSSMSYRRISPERNLGMLLDEVNQYLVVKMEDCFVIPERFLKAITNEFIARGIVSAYRTTDSGDVIPYCVSKITAEELVDVVVSVYCLYLGLDVSDALKLENVCSSFMSTYKAFCSSCTDSNLTKKYSAVASAMPDSISTLLDSNAADRVSYYKNAEVCLVKEYVRFVTREGMKRGYVYAPTYIKGGAEIINSACEWLKGIECLASCSSADLEGFYSRRSVGNVKILHGDMDIVMIVYSFPTNMDSRLLSNSVKCRCGEFVNDAKIKVLEKCMNSTKPELNCMRPEYLCVRRKQYNSHTRELFIQIGLRRDIESLKEKYSVVAI